MESEAKQQKNNNNEGQSPDGSPAFLLGSSQGINSPEVHKLRHFKLPADESIVAGMFFCCFPFIPLFVCPSFFLSLALAFFLVCG